MANPAGETINLNSLNVQQLSQVKKQLDEELEHLTGSFTQLHAAQAKFRECLRCVQGDAGAVSSQGDQSVLVPLTNSLYVQGRLSKAGNVLVDVGTGFFVEKDIKSAATFYENKIGELTGSIRELETIVQAKNGNVRVIEEVLSQKIQSPSGPTPSS